MGDERDAERREGEGEGDVGKVRRGEKGKGRGEEGKGRLAESGKGERKEEGRQEGKGRKRR